jgi:hypothetical protein
MHLENRALKNIPLVMQKYNNVAELRHFRGEASGIPSRFGA